ncbi:MAG: hypothetical protein Q7J84_18500 [Sulfuricaulis sp.]|nr:hypothetical protein [Sulfuricaulis sp.]
MTDTPPVNIRFFDFQIVVSAGAFGMTYAPLAATRSFPRCQSNNQQLSSQQQAITAQGNRKTKAGHALKGV